MKTDVFTFMTVSRFVFLRRRIALNGSCRENQNTHFMFNNFISESNTVYVTTWKNVVEPERPQLTIYMAHARCMLDKVGTHARTHVRTYAQRYVKLTALPRQKWFREGASMLCFTYIYSLVLPYRQYLQRGDWAQFMFL
jgi:hypothetical protein